MCQATLRARSDRGKFFGVNLLSEAGLGALAALGSAAIWAVISLRVRQLTPALNSITINAVRMSVSGGLLLAWVIVTQGTAELLAMSPAAFALLVLSIVVATGVGDTAFFESSRSIGLARAMTVSTTYPVIAAGLAAALLGELVSARVAAGSLVTLAGLVLIVSARSDHVPAHLGFRVGLAVAALAAVAWAVSVILLRPPLREMGALTAQAVRLPVAGALLSMTPWARGGVARLRAGGRALMWRMGAIGVLTTASSVLYVSGIKYSGVAVATVLSSTAPMFAIPLGALFLGERLSPRAVAGALVTVAGIAVLQL